ncbi:MAG TPA: PAS domain-containing protein [Rhizomicrobium sp.]|nr:PAS domain-containing protein [Rhizomicrobium sp.]
MQALGQVWGGLDPRARDYRETAKPLSAPTLHGAQTILKAWREAKDGFVVGRDIPSRPLSSVLRNLGLLEPLDRARDFRVRLAGTALLRRFGRDIKGATLSELYTQGAFERRRKWLTEAIDGERPVIHALTMQQGDGRPLSFERVYLPVLAPDRAAHWVLAGYFYYEDWPSC